MTTYSLDDGPSHVTDVGPGLLSGYYRAAFTTGDGRRLTRYLTDRGRATILERMDAGQMRFSDEELDEMTVEPDLGALEARFSAEAGEGG